MESTCFVLHACALCLPTFSLHSIKHSVCKHSVVCVCVCADTCKCAHTHTQTHTHTHAHTLMTHTHHAVDNMETTVLCFEKSGHIQRVTRMAYSPRLWLMAIGW